MDQDHSANHSVHVLDFASERRVRNYPSAGAFGSLNSLSSTFSCDLHGFHEDTPVRDTIPFKQAYRLTGEVLCRSEKNKVLAAVSRGTGQAAVVKQFDLKKISRLDRISVEHEVRIYASLKHPGHPNVAELLAVYRSRNHVRLVMERLNGGDTFDNLQASGTLTEQEVARVILQVLEAVEYLHGKGVVHRDIKLENVVYENRGGCRVKLIDFGLSCTWKEGMPALTLPVGTVEYMAPEVLTNQPYTSQVDMWGVGVVAYMLLIGERFGRSSDLTPRFSRHFDTLSAEARSFLSSLLKVNPRSRATVSEALAHSWLQGHRDSLVANRSPKAYNKAPLPELTLSTVVPGDTTKTRETLPELGELSAVGAAAIEARGHAWRGADGGGSRATARTPAARGWAGRLCACLWAGGKKTPRASRIHASEAAPET